MLNPDDSGNIFPENNPKIIGYVDTDSGGLLITDSLWVSNLPEVSQKRFERDLDIPEQRIPIKAFRKGTKRYLLIEIDEGVTLTTKSDLVDVEDPEVTQ